MGKVLVNSSSVKGFELKAMLKSVYTSPLRCSFGMIMLFLVDNAFIVFFVMMSSVRSSLSRGGSSSLFGCILLFLGCGMNCDAIVITSV